MKAPIQRILLHLNITIQKKQLMDKRWKIFYVLRYLIGILSQAKVLTPLVQVQWFVRPYNKFSGMDLAKARVEASFEFFEKMNCSC